MGVRKPDFEPLLAPGRHFLSLIEVEALCVTVFQGDSRQRRERLFLGLEEAVQALLRTRLPCRIFLDGSFLTKKPQPDDIDIVVCIDYKMGEVLTEEQRQVIDKLNEEAGFPNVDSTAYFTYPLGHQCFGCALDGNLACDGYGVEHGKVYLKGYVVLRLWETDVGIRICH